MIMNEFFASLIAIGHVVFASGVTIHVLLTHRDVRSSIGWIGLSWLSPYIGSMIYSAFGVNRVVRRPLTQRLLTREQPTSNVVSARTVLGDGFADNLVSIAESGNALSDLSLTTGNRLDLFCNGDEAYPAMLTAIDQAEHSIALASYIFASDKIGNTFAQHIIAAHQRGVEVRVLIDGIGSGYFNTPVLRTLSAAGVPTEQFLHSWLPWHMTFINLRNHKKLLIIDGKSAFTGGMNIADENVGEGTLPDVQDVHVRLQGPVVEQLMMTFARDWNFTSAEELVGERWWPKIPVAGDHVMRGIASGPDESVGRIETLFAAAIGQAKHRIRIVTPYFLPEDPLFEVVRRAALRGVTVEIVTPKRSNHFYFNWAITAHLETFPLEGIDCYLTPEPFDHSKLMSVDGEWCSFGSANWDARSMRLNFEFQVECYGPEVAKQIDALIDRKLLLAKKLTIDAMSNRPTWQRLRNAGARLFLPYL